MIAELVGEAANWICAIIAQDRRVVVVKVCFSIYMTRRQVKVSLGDRFRATEIQACPSVAGRTRRITDTFAVAKDRWHEGIKEKLLVLRFVLWK